MSSMSDWKHCSRWAGTGCYEFLLLFCHTWQRQSRLCGGSFLLKLKPCMSGRPLSCISYSFFLSLSLDWSVGSASAGAGYGAFGLNWIDYHRYSTAITSLLSTHWPHSAHTTYQAGDWGFVSSSVGPGRDLAFYDHDGVLTFLAYPDMTPPSLSIPLLFTLLHALEVNHSKYWFL